MVLEAFVNKSSWILLGVFVPISAILFYFAFLDQGAPIEQETSSTSAFCEETCRQEAYGLITERLFSYYSEIEALSRVDKETLLNQGIEVSWSNTPIGPSPDERRQIEGFPTLDTVEDIAKKIFETQLLERLNWLNEYTAPKGGITYPIRRGELLAGPSAGILWGIINTDRSLIIQGIIEERIRRTEANLNQQQ